MKKRILFVEDDAAFRVGNPIPTVVLTASLQTSVAGRAMEAGARGALSKVASMRDAVMAIGRLTEAGRWEA
jgi:DNA-binding NarL/FixJ family response regulator